MNLPAILSRQSEVEHAVDEITRLLAPDVAHIRYEIEQDWSGQWAIFFRVLLSDEAGEKRLRAVATQVVSRLAERLDFTSLGVVPYHNFRSVSEQAALREEAWA